jgi:hypothetical protein
MAIIQAHQELYNVLINYIRVTILTRTTQFSARREHLHSESRFVCSANNADKIPT